MEPIEIAKALRADEQVHYNCCQSVVLSFADALGLSREQAFALTSHFGSGMRHGSTCGAVTGALLVLGGLGVTGPEAVAMLNRFREGHGALDCATLLRTSHEAGIARKEHCDGLVFEMVRAVEAIREARRQG